jgi:P4 family phage/plasmid primase-like protien
MSGAAVKVARNISSATVETMIAISHGLTSSDKGANLKSIPLSNIESYLTKHTDCYEQRLPISRPIIDIDGEADGDMSIDDFESLCCIIEVALRGADLPPHVLMTSNKYQALKDPRSNERINKLSFRIHFTETAGSYAANKAWIKKNILSIIQDLLKEQCEINLLIKSEAERADAYPATYLEWDDSIYCKGKLRCVNSSKWANDLRPLTICSDNTILDTLSSYVPNGCEMLSEPVVEAVEAVLQTPPMEPSPRVEVCESASTASTDDNAALLTDILNNVGAHRRNDFTYWIQAGIICFNEGNHFKVWDDWSKKSPKYDGSTVRMWAGFRKSALSIATLWFWLKQDNKEVFSEMRSKQMCFEKLIGDPNDHGPIAQYFYSIHSLDYLYCPHTKWWYMNNQNVWINSNKEAPPGLTLAMNRLFTAERIAYESTLAKRKAAANESNNDSEIKRLDGLSKKSNEFVGKTTGRASTILSSIIHFLKDFYAESTLLMLQTLNAQNVPQIMNAKLNLFAFNNKVVDLDTGASRRIEPRDYVSFTTGYDMPEASNATLRSTMIRKLNTIWEDDVMFKYVMSILSTCLSGVRRLEEFYILTGEGGNGKGALTDLLKNVFGTYFGTMDHQVLTQRDESADRANPSIYNLYGRRYVNSTEPDAGIKLREDKIKKLTGGDELIGRQLFGNPITFKPQFGLFLQCNNIPKLSGLTKGIVRRLRIIPFPFNFVEQPTPGTNERKADFNLKTEMCVSQEWRNEFVLYLLDIYAEIQRNQFVIPRPKQVGDATDTYLSSNNQIGEWFKANYIKDATADTQGRPLHFLRTKPLLDAFKLHIENHRLTDAEFCNMLKFNSLDPIKTDYRVGGVVQSRNVMCLVGYREMTEEDRAVRVLEAAKE